MAGVIRQQPPIRSRNTPQRRVQSIKGVIERPQLESSTVHERAWK